MTVIYAPEEFVHSLVGTLTAEDILELTEVAGVFHKETNPKNVEGALQASLLLLKEGKGGSLPLKSIVGCYCGVDKPRHLRYILISLATLSIEKDPGSTVVEKIAELWRDLNEPGSSKPAPGLVSKKVTGLSKLVADLLRNFGPKVS